MKKLFLVEDDTSLGETLSERLSQDYQITWAKSCEQALQNVNQNKNIDLFIFDIGLPDGNGFDLAKKIRQQVKAPFLFLTAQADAESRLQGYQLGAEEFIPKPFHLKELLIRIEHVIKMHSINDIVQVGQVQINFSDLQIINEKKDKISLSDSEMKVLEILIRQSPKVIDRDQIMNDVWGRDSELSYRSIDNIIVKIRSALSTAGSNIRTVRGRGYQWINDSVE